MRFVVLADMARCTRQAELSGAWKQRHRNKAKSPRGARHGPLDSDPDHAFQLVHSQPNLRREVASHLTDALRTALLKGEDYNVGVSEFVNAEHTPKNRLITAIRRRRRSDQPSGYSAPRVNAWAEYRALRESTGGCGIKLGRLLGADS